MANTKPRKDKDSWMVMIVALVGVIAIMIMVSSNFGLSFSKSGSVAGKAVQSSDDGLQDTEPAGVKSNALSYVPIPYTDIDAGIYYEPIEVQLYVNVDGAVIRYTLDNSEPDENSMAYRDPIKMPADTNLKAKAFKEGLTPSTTMLARYFVRP